jgi:hypothetical protein
MIRMGRTVAVEGPAKSRQVAFGWARQILLLTKAFAQNPNSLRKAREMGHAGYGVILKTVPSLLEPPS